MDKIVCLVGESGCGKTTIAELLEAKGYNYIISYTDRPKRNDHEKGHIFIGESYEQWVLKNKGTKIIAETIFDKHRYWATKDQYTNKGISVYTVDPSGVRDLREYIDDAEVKAVYLKCDEVNRIERMKADKRSESIINERIYNDKEVFKIVECDYIVDANGTIEEVLKLVISAIDKPV